MARQSFGSLLRRQSQPRSFSLAQVSATAPPQSAEPNDFRTRVTPDGLSLEAALNQLPSFAKSQ